MGTQRIRHVLDVLDEINRWYIVYSQAYLYSNSFVLAVWVPEEALREVAVSALESAWAPGGD